MEMRARYVQVGAFTLAVILAGFVFVYWLNSATGLGSRSVYIVRFEGSVSGLLYGISGAVQWRSRRRGHAA